jgi:hypothetical protein
VKIRPVGTIAQSCKTLPPNNPIQVNMHCEKCGESFVHFPKKSEFFPQNENSHFEKKSDFLGKWTKFSLHFSSVAV